MAYTQRDHNVDSSSREPYSGSADTENLVSFHRAKSWIGRPLQPNEENVDHTERTVGGQHQSGGTKHGEPEYSPARREDVPVVNRLVASASTAPIYEQPNHPVEDSQEKHIQVPDPLHPVLPEIFDQGKLVIILNRVILTIPKT